MEKNEKIEERKTVKDFREVIKNTVTKYPENIAYKYKEDYTQKDTKIIEKTYKQLDEDVKALGTIFLEYGLEGKKVSVIGKNSYKWAVTYLAATTGGMTIVPLDKALPEKEIENLLLRSEAEAIVLEGKYIEVAKRIKEKTGILKHIISMDKIEEEVLEFDEIVEKGKKLIKEGNTKYEKIKIDPKAMSIILFTSGTTSLPKGVMLSQSNICANISALAPQVKLYPTDTMLSFLPIHHTLEATATFIYGLYSGVTVAFCDGLKYLQSNLVEYKISAFVSVPLVLETMYKKIQKALEDAGKTEKINRIVELSNGLLEEGIDLRGMLFKDIVANFGGNLRLVMYGAAPMNKDTIIGYNNFGINLVQGYGLTETSPIIAVETDERRRPGSVGPVLPNLEVEIVDKDKDDVGEITVKGPSVMMGYYKNQEESDKVLKHGWFSTGDYGYLDKDGFLFVTGRKKDVIVLKNGKNVYPQEIEFLINKLLYISESMVYSREESSTDTMLCAKIVYDTESIKKYLGEKTEEEYKEIIWKEIKEINKELPIFKRIKNIIITNNPFAKTTTQKLKRYEEMKTLN